MTAAEPTYYVRADGGPVQGPFAVSRLHRYIAEGRVRADMHFSMDGRTWQPGTSWTELFPAAELPRRPGLERDVDAPAPQPGLSSAKRRVRRRETRHEVRSMPWRLMLGAVAVAVVLVAALPKAKEQDQLVARLFAIVDECNEIMEGPTPLSHEPITRLVGLVTQVRGMEDDIERVRRTLEEEEGERLMRALARFERNLVSTERRLQAGGDDRLRWLRR